MRMALKQQLLNYNKNINNCKIKLKLRKNKFKILST